MEDDGLIMMGDLPKWKMEKIWSGLIVMGDLLDKEKMWSGLIIMGDLPKWKWWSHYDGWPTQMKVVVSLWWVTYPIKKKCDLPGKKTWLEKSWQDKVDKLRFLIAGLTWRPLLMTWLISLFLCDFPTGRVHLIPFSFQDLNRWFFVIIDSMILSVHNLAGLHWGFSCNNSKICAMLWG